MKRGRSMASDGGPPTVCRRRRLPPAAFFLGLAVLAACATRAPEVTPAATIRELTDPTGDVRAIDVRGEFRAVLCRTARDLGSQFPDNRTCEAMLRTVAPEPPAAPPPADVVTPVGPYTILIVPGLGFDCFTHLIGSPGELLETIRAQGHDVRVVPVQGLGDTRSNAAIVRDAVAGLDAEARQRPLLLVGYSKGTPDILTALVDYPEIVPSVAAVVSIAGAAGGSPLADDATRWSLDLLASLPGSQCEKSTGDTLASLRPATRRAWLATHALPPGPAYFSLVTWPEPDRVTTVLQGSYRSLATLDPRNDSQVLVPDQVVPGSRLLGFLNADHWAVAVPVSRSHPVLAATVVDHNDFPREVLMLAVLRYVDNVLAQRPA